MRSFAPCRAALSLSLSRFHSSFLRFTIRFRYIHFVSVSLSLLDIRSQRTQDVTSGIIPTEVGSYLGFLSLFITPPMVNDFVSHTNSDAPASWPGTTEGELYAFIGVHIYMGIDRLAVLED